MFRTPEQRKAFFARQQRVFPLRGQSHRAERNRAIVGAAGVGLGVAGAIGVRRLSRFAFPSLFDTSRHWDMGGTLTTIRPAEGWEPYFLNNRATRAGARRLFGGPTPLGRARRMKGGGWEVSAIPPHLRKLYPTGRTGTAPLMGRGRTGMLGRRAKKAEDASIWFVLGRDPETGDPRLYRKLEEAQQGAISWGHRRLRKAKELITEPHIPRRERMPGGALYEAKETFRKENQELLRKLTLMHEADFRKLGRNDPKKEALKYIDRYVTQEAKLKIQDQFPPLIERATKRVFRPLDERLKRWDEQLNRWAIRKGQKHGLPIHKRRVNLAKPMKGKFNMHKAQGDS